MKLVSLIVLFGIYKLSINVFSLLNIKDIISGGLNNLKYYPDSKNDFQYFGLKDTNIKKLIEMVISNIEKRDKSKKIKFDNDTIFNEIKDLHNNYKLHPECDTVFCIGDIVNKLERFEKNRTLTFLKKDNINSRPTLFLIKSYVHTFNGSSFIVNLLTEKNIYILKEDLDDIISISFIPDYSINRLTSIM
jgi:hypothetical protein